MKQLNLDSFAATKLPSRAELEIKGGIGCNEAVEVMNDVVDDTGWDGYCGMTIQCTTSSGGQGSVPGVCPASLQE